MSETTTKKEYWAIGRVRFWKNLKIDEPDLAAWKLSFAAEYGVGFIPVYETQEEALAHSPNGQVFLFREASE